ncbi:S41 family peptidase [Flavobacteriaceae bacterium LMO-SS05]
MKILKIFLIAGIVGSITLSCFKDKDDHAILASEINDFVWKGMNAVYLYKDQIPNLANDRFTSDQEYGNYLNTFSTPESLFESLIYDRSTTDRFSVIVDDYIAFEQLLNGTTKTNGLRYYSFQDPGSSNRILAIRQVIPNSAGDVAHLVRGQYIIQIDGTAITSDNVGTLLSPDTFTLHFADHNDNGTPETSDDTFTSNGTTVTLTKTILTENPIHNTSIIDVDGEKLGYIFYNSFNQNFNTELNNAFANFKSNNIQHLVIDLRYNPGGSVDTSRLLGSMITGQFNGQVFSKLVWNNDLQEFNTNYEFLNKFDGKTINSLNLDKIYVLTTGSTASASELLINSLKEYITVVQIGENTVGKTQASITIYDSPDFGRDKVNPNHLYAMQPLVANSINVNDQAVPGTGLTPTLPLNEDVYNLGLFGNVNEPLLARAIADIRGTGRFGQFSTQKTPKYIPYDSPVNENMYIDPESVPPLLKKQFN